MTEETKAILEKVRDKIAEERDKHRGCFECDDPISWGNREMADTVLSIIDKYIRGDEG